MSVLVAEKYDTAAGNDGGENSQQPYLASETEENMFLPKKKSYFFPALALALQLH